MEGIDRGLLVCVEFWWYIMHGAWATVLSALEPRSSMLHPFASAAGNELHTPAYLICASMNSALLCVVRRPLGRRPPRLGVASGMSMSARFE